MYLHSECLVSTSLFRKFRAVALRTTSDMFDTGRVFDLMCRVVQVCTCNLSVLSLMWALAQSGPMWTQCGLHVDSLWTRFQNQLPRSKTRHCKKKFDRMWTRCGPDVDSMWTRCGLPSPIVVQQMWTQTPFSIYNNIGGGGRRVHTETTRTLYWGPVAKRGVSHAR